MRKKSNFFKGALIYFIILISLIILILAILWLYLTNFQKSRSEDVMKRFVASQDISNMLYGKIDLSGSYEEESRVIKGINNIIKDKSLTYVQNLKNSTEENPIYVLKADNEPVLEFTLEPGDNLAFGLKGWNIKTVKVSEKDKAVKDLQVMVPKGGTLYIDGQVVSDNVPKEEKNIELLENLKSQGLAGDVPALECYKLGDFFETPELKVVDVNGNDVSLEKSEDKNTYMPNYTADEAFVASVKDRVLSVIEPYALFQSNDVRFAVLSPYLGSGTELSRKIASSDVKWFADHSGTSFENKEAKDFKKYSDDCFSCNVTFTQSLVTKELGKIDYHGDYTWIFLKNGDQWYLCDMVTNEAK